MIAAAKQFQAPETRKYSQAQVIKLLDAAPELAAFAMQRARAPEIRLAPKPFNHQRRRKKPHRMRWTPRFSPRQFGRRRPQ